MLIEDEFIYSIFTLNNLKMKELLVSSSHLFDPSVENNEALNVAVETNDLDLVHLLLNDKRIDPTAQDYSALMSSMRRRQLNIFKAILKHRLIKPNFNKNCFIVAAEIVQAYDFSEFLWYNKSVQNSLKKDNPTIFKGLEFRYTKKTIVNF